MIFEKQSETSFILKDEASGDVQTFTFKDHFGLWEVKQMGLFLEQLTKSCSRAGAMLVSMVLTGIQVTTKQDLTPLADVISRLTNEHLFDSAAQGLGEIVGFFVKDDNIERIAAILCLKPNEKKLDAEQLDARINLFRDNIELEFLWGVVQHFFGERLEYWRSTLSPSKIFGMPKSEPVIQTSESSTTTSERSTDTLMPSPKDTPSESPQS